MFEGLLNRLLAPEPEQLPEDDCRTALAALLVRVAKADGHYAEAEVAKIDHILAARYGMGATEVETLRTEAETLEQEAPDTVRFTRAIKDAVPYEEREAVMVALWTVALADGGRDYEEDALLRLVAGLLGVEDIDSNMARKRVEAQL